jgi:YVTN family beta-propeller protein
MTYNTRTRAVVRGILAGAAIFAIAPALGAAPAITAGNWGGVTSPVYGTSESGVYKGAELFAGPRKFADGQYYHGVLPNGRIVKPAGTSIQIGMDPLGLALTPDGHFLITSNDDERNGSLDRPTGSSLQSDINRGGYSLSVVDARTMKVVSQIASGPVYVGLQVTGRGPYTVWASGGPSNSIKLFDLSTAGSISSKDQEIVIPPTLPANRGYVSHYVPGKAFDTEDADGNKPPIPIGFDRENGGQITFPAGSALSPDGRFLYVACNADNSVAVINTGSRKVVRQVPVGYFPFGVSVTADGSRVLVSNWGITEYKYYDPEYDTSGKLIALHATPDNQPDGYYVPPTDTKGAHPKTSSVSILSAPGGDGARLTSVRSVYHGKPLDALYQVGDTHPSGIVIVSRPAANGAPAMEAAYVTKANSDSIGIIIPGETGRIPEVDLSPIHMTLADGHPVHGAYPNAIAYSPKSRRLYVAEAGLNSVAVLDASDLRKPKLVGRIPTGWYPTGVAVSPDGRYLYVVNAKGIGEDINPRTPVPGENHATGTESFADSNYVFGSVQQVDLAAVHPDNTSVLGYNFAYHKPANTEIVPEGGKPSPKINHVFFILHENKSFDSMLGNMDGRFGPYASLNYNNPDGSPFSSPQYTGVDRNLQALANAFATAVNYYSDSEESDAGHQFAASGTASDYTEKTLLEKGGRGSLVQKHMEPEDYPEGGYIFNNAARHHVNFKMFGDLIRIAGTDDGNNVPTVINDPTSGLAGLPLLNDDKTAISDPLETAGDVDSRTVGLGRSFFLAMPVLAILGGKNANGEARIDPNYPGYNFNISDQRRAKEFIQDFDRMVRQGTLPRFVYLYQPNDHTGGIKAPNKAEVGGAPMQQVGDGDVGLGMVVDHIMKSRVYYRPETGQGSAIFITDDDAQGCLDHIHPHRTPLVVVSPYAKPAYTAKRHYVTASIVKTEDLLLGLPPNNDGDLFATDLRDMFQPTYNGLTADDVTFNKVVRYQPSTEGLHVWELISRLDDSAPDRDSYRIARLGRISAQADALHDEAARNGTLQTAAYREEQDAIYDLAARIVAMPAARDDD